MCIWRSSGGPYSEMLFPKIHLSDGSAFHAYHSEIVGEAAEEPPHQIPLGPPLTLKDVTGCESGFERIPDSHLFPFRKIETCQENEPDARFKNLVHGKIDPFHYAPKLRPVSALSPPSLVTIPDDIFDIHVTEVKIETPRSAGLPPEPEAPPWDWKA